MSVLETVKQKVGIGEKKATYECNDCGAEFQSSAEPGSYWFTCPECDSDDLTELE